MGYESEIKKLEVRWEDNPKQYFAPLADAYRKNGDFEKAVKLIDDGLAERPDYVSAYIVLGRTRVGLEEYDEAARVFEQVLEYDGENIIALSQLAELSEKMDDLTGAIRWLRRLLEVDPMNHAATRLDQLEKASGAAHPETEAEDAVPVTGAPDAAEGISFADIMDGDSAGTEEPQPVAEDTGQDLAQEGAGRRPALDEIETVVDMVAVDLPGSEAPAPEEGAPAEGSLDLSALADEPTTGIVEVGDEVIAQPPEDGSEEPRAEVLTEPEVENDATGDTPLELVEDSAEAVEFIEPAAPASDVSTDDEPEEIQVVPEEAVTEPEDAGEPVAAVSPPRFPSSLENIPVIIPEEVDEGELPGISQSVDEPSPEPVVTETMANVFAQQGMVDQARQVYLQLLEAQPDNEKLRAEMEKLDSMQTLEARPSPPAGPKFSVADTGGKSSRAFLQGMLSAVVDNEVAVPEGAPPADGPDESATPRSRLSFDDFYGAAGAADPVDEPGDERPVDDDFKDWLKGLKS